MIRPLNKRLVVEPVNEEETARIAVVRFDKYNQKSSGVEGKTRTRGIVLAVGNGCDKVDGARMGDIIRFTHNGGLPVQFDGKDLLLISEKDIFGVEYADCPATH